MDFKGKNILVVGGSSGIGLALVEFLQASGAGVYVISRSANPSWPASVKHLPIDVLEENLDLQAFLPEHLHGLVYSVGSINLKPFHRLSTEDFLNDYRLNVVGSIKIIQQSLKALKAASGSSIVFISSVAARLGMGFHGSISASKGAVEGLAISLAAEYVSSKIRVNVIAPSLTDTSLAASLLSTPEKRSASGLRHPLGRVGQPEDISSAIAFLLHENSSWMTGQVIGIDGGLGKLKTG